VQTKEWIHLRSTDWQIARDIILRNWLLIKIYLSLQHFMKRWLLQAIQKSTPIYLFKTSTS